MLAEVGGRRAGLPGRAVEVDRGRDHLGRRGTVGYVDQGSRGPELRIGQQVVRRLDRGPEEIRLRGEDVDPLVEGAGREDPVELADQLDGVDRTIGGGRIPGVVDPLGMPDDPGHRRPVPVRLQADHPESPTVACDIVVDRGVAHRVPVSRRQGQPPADGDGEVEADGVDALAEQRGRAQLAPPCSFSVVQRSRHARCRGEPGIVVAHATPLERGIAPLRCEQVGDARPRPEGGDVVGGLVPVRTVEPVSGDGGVDEAGMLGQECPVVEAEPVEARQAHVGEEDVGVGDE